MILGCAGFVGSHLAELLVKQGVETFGLIAPGTRLDNLEVGKESIHLLEADVRDEVALSARLKEVLPEQVYNLAAVSSVPLSFRNPRLTYEVNVNGALNLYESVRSLGLKPRILNVSSAQVYGSLPEGEAPFDENSGLNPGNPYASSKAMAELLARQYVETFGLAIVTVRPFNHIGPRQSTEFVCSDFARQVALMKRGNSLPVLRTGNIDVERDFTDVRDVVQAYWQLLAKGAAGEVYNVCSGRLLSLREIVHTLGRLAGLNIEIQVEASRLRSADVSRVWGSPKKIFQAVGWKPGIPLERSLKDLLEYWESKLH